jgi:hypothetical protein
VTSGAFVRSYCARGANRFFSGWRALCVARGSPRRHSAPAQEGLGAPGGGVLSSTKYPINRLASAVTFGDVGIGEWYRAGLDDVAGSEILQTIGTDGLAIDCAVHEGRMLKRDPSGAGSACPAGGVFWSGAGVARRGPLPRGGGREQTPGARRLVFLCNGLLFGIG